MRFMIEKFYVRKKIMFMFYFYVSKLKNCLLTLATHIYRPKPPSTLGATMSEKKDLERIILYISLPT